MSHYEVFGNQDQRLQPWTFKWKEEHKIWNGDETIFSLVTHACRCSVHSTVMSAYNTQSDKYHIVVFLDPARLDYLLHILHVRWICGNRLKKKVNQNFVMCEFTSITCDRKNTFLWSTNHRIGVYKGSLHTWLSSEEYLSQWLRIS